MVAHGVQGSCAAPRAYLLTLCFAWGEVALGHPWGDLDTRLKCPAGTGTETGVFQTVTSERPPSMWDMSVGLAGRSGTEWKEAAEGESGNHRARVRNQLAQVRGAPQVAGEELLQGWGRGGWEGGAGALWEVRSNTTCCLRGSHATEREESGELVPKVWVLQHP